MNYFDKLAELSAQLSQIYAQWAKKQDLTLNELHFLYYIGRNGQCSPTEIGEKWSLPKQTVTSVCKQLDGKGFLSFLPDENDKRAKVIRLTEQGEQFIRPLIEQLTQAELETCAMIGDEDFARLIQALTQVQQIFAEKLNKE